MRSGLCMYMQAVMGYWGIFKGMGFVRKNTRLF